MEPISIRKGAFPGRSRHVPIAEKPKTGTRRPPGNQVRKNTPDTAKRGRRHIKERHAGASRKKPRLVFVAVKMPKLEDKINIRAASHFCAKYLDRRS